MVITIRLGLRELFRLGKPDHPMLHIWGEHWESRATINKNNNIYIIFYHGLRTSQERDKHVRLQNQQEKNSKQRGVLFREGLQNRVGSIKTTVEAVEGST